MEVITLNKEAFSNSSAKLISKIDFQPDIIVGILNGGGYVVEEIKRAKEFDQVRIELVKLNKRKGLKNNPVVKFVLNSLPTVITDKLRVLESKKARKSINNLDLDSLNNYSIDLKFDSDTKEKIKSILIIDDAIDTGKTMFVIKNNLSKSFPNAEIKTAIISWTIQTSIVKPDYWLYKNILVRFPWSIDYKAKDFEKKSFSC